MTADSHKPGASSRGPFGSAFATGGCCWTIFDHPHRANGAQQAKRVWRRELNELFPRREIQQFDFGSTARSTSILECCTGSVAHCDGTTGHRITTMGCYIARPEKKNLMCVLLGAVSSGHRGCPRLLPVYRMRGPVPMCPQRACQHLAFSKPGSVRRRHHHNHNY